MGIGGGMLEERYRNALTWAAIVLFSLALLAALGFLLFALYQDVTPEGRVALLFLLGFGGMWALLMCFIPAVLRWIDRRRNR